MVLLSGTRLSPLNNFVHRMVKVTRLIVQCPLHIVHRTHCTSDIHWFILNLNSVVSLADLGWW